MQLCRFLCNNWLVKCGSSILASRLSELSLFIMARQRVIQLLYIDSPIEVRHAFCFALMRLEYLTFILSLYYSQ